MTERKIMTNYWAKPVPSSKFDWSAMFDDEMDEDGLCGYGATEDEAVADLKEMEEERL